MGATWPACGTTLSAAKLRIARAPRTTTTTAAKARTYFDISDLLVCIPGPLPLSILKSHNRNSGLVGPGEDFVQIKNQRLMGFERYAGGMCLLHHLNGLHADHGNIESHVLFRLGYLHYGQAAFQRRG